MMTQNTSQQYHWMMISGWKNQFQRGTCASMKIHNMIRALTSLNPLHLAQEDALQFMELNNMFEFPDIIVSASNDDVPSMEDILRL